MLPDLRLSISVPGYYLLLKRLTPKSSIYSLKLQILQKYRETRDKGEIIEKY